MLTKFIASIICIVTMMITSKTLEEPKQLEEVYENTVVQSNVMLEETNNEVENTTYEVQEAKNETVNNTVNSTIKKKNEEVTITNTKQEEKVEEVKETSSQEKEQKAEPKKEQKKEQKKEESTQTIKKEVEEKTKEVKQEPKEEYIYNDAETKKIIADINEIAKRNPELWGENGEKQYKVEISSSLIGQNYMSPYKKSQVEGIVLNVFPVKFLVYAIDYERAGFTTETRYYIDIAEY